jgi:mannose-1-phosphate guanylyltransferase
VVEAVILAGGLGTRLRPLTDRRPKHLLPVGGVPFLQHQLAKLASVGIKHVVLATFYHAADFEPVFGDGSALGLALDYLTETEPLGTGGGLRNAAAALRGAPEDSVVVLNGDQLSGHDITAQLAHFDATGAELSLHLVEVPDPTAFGCVPTDAADRVEAFLEKSPDPATNQINAGCYVFRRGVIDSIPAGQVVSLERDTFPGLLRDGASVIGYRESAYWRDVGTPEALVEASCDLVRGVAPSPAYPYPPSEWLIDDSADVAVPDLVTGGSAIGPGAQVAADAVVDASVVMADARLAGSVRLVGSVVGPGARVGARTRLHNVTVGDNAVVGADCELPGGTKVPCDAIVPDGSTRLTL